MASSASWHIAGDYFENCNCDVVCPCLFSPKPAFMATPTEGDCKVAFGFHIDRGSFEGVTLDGLNCALTVYTPGPMADGNWSLALYTDERADDRQREALQAIFGGAAGGPIGDLAPFVGKVLGVQAAPITWRKEGQHRSIEIAGRMAMAVSAAPSIVPGQPILARNAHPFAPEVAMAVGDSGSTWSDYGSKWDNSGKNGHYAAIDWSNG